IVRVIMEPWLQFFRTIPPIALIPLVIVVAGINESAKIAVIFFCSFLVMVIAIFQGVTNVDNVLIKAARTFGANDKDIFLTVIVPASFPYILVAARLGISTSLTSLIASEMTGSRAGLGNMIQEASLYFDMTRVILGIAVIGTIGLVLDKLLLFLEKKLTAWQEVRRT
ncbi:MAG: ABC transporter permease subunit, partial [Clostridiaceae bacterium]|nr:ABC transporter permease subunit [Clostridiaceae bacterium]